MRFVEYIVNNNLVEAKKEIFALLSRIVEKRLSEAKVYVAADNYEEIEVLDEKRNPNLVKMGRITRIRRRIRRNAKGRIVVQRNRRRSGIKGYRIAGNTVRRIPATERLRKALTRLRS